MDGDFGYLRDPRQFDGEETDDGLGVVRGILWALTIEAAVVAIGWGAWLLIGSVFS